MAVGPDDEVVGSVSGGCVEGAVFEPAREAVADGEARTETFGYSDEDAIAVGLTRGGEITVLVRPVTPELDQAFGAVAGSVAAGEPVTVATVTDGFAPRGATLAVRPDRALGILGTTGLDAAVTADARGGRTLGATGLRHYGPRGQRREDTVSVFLQSSRRRACLSSARSTSGSCPGCAHRSGSISAPVRPRRWPCPWPPRSSHCAGAARAPR
ncbi:hypothetical protein GCM10010340_29210 [Streptomyces griseoloalbus]|nr:hypothetical protein GCM10010340_29210 [Streptomyces albaduncus]